MAKSTHICPVNGCESLSSIEQFCMCIWREHCGEAWLSLAAETEIETSDLGQPKQTFLPFWPKFTWNTCVSVLVLNTSQNAMFGFNFAAMLLRTILWHTSVGLISSVEWICVIHMHSDKILLLWCWNAAISDAVAVRCFCYHFVDSRGIFIFSIYNYTECDLNCKLAFYRTRFHIFL